MKSTFFIELEALSTAPENLLGNWKQLCKIGHWGKHPRYGDIEFTSIMLESFFRNFKSNAIGRDLSFNYNHAEGQKRAALWIKDIRKVLDSAGNVIALEYLPKYTPSGLQLIQGEEFKYVSIEYADNFNGNGPTLLGAACTNDPFVTGEGLTELETKEDKKYMPTEIEKLTEELQGLQTTVKKMEAEKQKFEEKRKSEEVKKLEEASTLNEQIKLLQAQHRAEIQKQANELLQMRVKNLRMEWSQAGVFGGLMDIAEKRILESHNSRICLENTDGSNEIDLISYTNELFAAIPNDKRVNLSQAEKSGVWVKNEPSKTTAKTEEEKIEAVLLEAVNELNERRKV